MLNASKNFKAELTEEEYVQVKQKFSYLKDKSKEEVENFFTEFTKKSVDYHSGFLERDNGTNHQLLVDNFTKEEMALFFLEIFTFKITTVLHRVYNLNKQDKFREASEDDIRFIKMLEPKK